MTSENRHEIGYTKYSDEWFLNEYLKFGSVESALQNHGYSLPISVAQFHRLVKSHGIVKSVGRREVDLSEVLYFFLKKALEPTLALQTLYWEMPANFRTSLVSLHRIYKRILDHKPERSATALIIHPQNDNNYVLVGNETQTKALYGKHKGDISIPMSFSKKNEDPKASILRVLQQEFSTKLAINGNLLDLLPINPDPVVHMQIVDVEVAAYEIYLPQNLTDLKSCSSYKLVDHRFDKVDKLLNSDQPIRSGITEMLTKSGRFESHLNLELTKAEPSLKFAYDFEKYMPE